MASWTDPTAFAQVWATAVASRPDETFLIFEAPNGHVTSWTYCEFDAVVSRMATELARREVRSGASVHLALTNSPTFIAVWLAGCIAIGAMAAWGF